MIYYGMITLKGDLGFISLDRRLNKKIFKVTAEMEAWSMFIQAISNYGAL